MSKSRTRFLIAIAALLVLGSVFLAAKQAGCSEEYKSNASLALPDPRNRIKLEVAYDAASLSRGLSGRKCLPDDQGMLFFFQAADKHCFWMKDMNFPLDIIWLNEKKVIVDLRTNLSPDTYPQSFCPKDSAEWVIELNAGSAAKHSFDLGDQLAF
jgi:uncharacterized protein